MDYFFGVALKTQGMVGSPYWMPPEMIRGQPHSYPVDTWSAGVCLLELCNGHAPKMGNAFKSMFSTGSGVVPPLKKPDTWSMTMQDFFAKVLSSWFFFGCLTRKKRCWRLTR